MELIRDYDVIDRHGLRAFRSKENISQQALGDMIGVTQRAVSYWEDHREWVNPCRTNFERLMRLGNPRIIDYNGYRWIREQLAMNQRQFANAIGVIPKMVSRYENAESRPSQATFDRIVALYFANV